METRDFDFINFYEQYRTHYKTPVLYDLVSISRNYYPDPLVYFIARKLRYTTRDVQLSIHTADPPYPPEKVSNISVDTGIKWQTTSVSPGYNSVKDAIRRKGPSRIAITRILTALQVTRADHSIGDAADVSVYISTRLSAHDRKRYLH